MKNLMLVFIIIALFLLMGCTEIKKVADPCRSAFEDCNYSCGEGVLSSICKEKCTYDYNTCREQNK